LFAQWIITPQKVSPMRLAVFNGSPRKKAGNTQILLEKFAEGYKSIDSDVLFGAYLKDMQKAGENVKAFKEADIIVIGFPLYTDAMPGVVKYFFEKLWLEKPLSGKKLGFIVQSGFPEAIHSTFVEKYLERFTENLGCEYLGTIIKGGGEAIRQTPEKSNRKLFDYFRKLGKELARNQQFNQDILQELKKTYMFSPAVRFVFRVIRPMGLFDRYWNKELKKNNAFEKRYDAPYSGS